MIPVTFAWRTEDGLVHRTWSIDKDNPIMRRPTYCEPTTMSYPHKTVVKRDAVVTCVRCLARGG